MPEKALGLVGVFHEVGFEPAAGNALVENREYLDRLLGFLSEKIGAGELKSIALEANPKALAEHRKFASLLEAQPDPKKLALPKDLSGLPRGKLRDAFEAMVKKHGGDRYRALEFFAIKVYWSRLVSFLDGKNPAGKKIEITNAFTVKEILSLCTDVVLVKSYRPQDLYQLRITIFGKKIVLFP